MIDPTKIPQLDLGKISALEAAAGKLKSVGGDVKTTGANVHATFQGLSGFYDAPEAGLLFNSTRPVKTQSETFGHDTTGVGAALATFAAEIRPIATRLHGLHGKAASFQKEIKGDHHWQDDNGKVDENNQLLHDINGAVVQLMAAERKAANAIEAAFGGTRRWHTGNSKNDPNAYGVNNIPDDANTPWGSHESHRAWYDKFGDWVGDHVVPDWGWAQAAWSGYSSFLKGFWVDGVWGTLTGLYKLSTTNAILDPKSFLASWKGVGLLGLDGAMWVTPGLGSSLTIAAKTGALPKPMANVVNEANSTGVNFAKGLVAWDEWGKDPARAGGAVTFNVLTAIIPGPKGGGALAKLLGGLGEDAGKVGIAAEDASRAGSVAEDAGKLGDLAETAPHVDLPTAGDLAKDFDIPPVGNDLPHIGDDLPNLGDHAPGHDLVPSHPGDIPGAGHDPIPPGGAHDPVPPTHDPAPPGDHGLPPGHDPVPPGGEHGGVPSGDPGLGHPPNTPTTEIRHAEAEISSGAKTFPTDADAVRYGADHWNHYAENLPASEKQALFDYTTDPPHSPNYQDINGYLRNGGTPKPGVAHDIAEMDKALAGNPVPEDVVVTRGTDLGHISMPPSHMVGQKFTDPAYTSTSLGGPADAFADKEAVLHLRVPKGTPALWVEKVSAYGPGERELLLGRGMTYRVDHVIWDHGQWQIYGEFVPR